MTTTPRPPRLARALAARLLRGEMREVVLGDLDEEFARALAAGVAPARARRRYWRQAMASLVPRREPREGTRPILLAGFSQDLRYAARVVAHRPAFTAIAVLSLGIGIGANTTVYHVIRTLILAPLPVHRPDELALVYWANPPKTQVRISQMNSSGWPDPQSGRTFGSNLTYRMFEAVRDVTPAPADLFAFNFLSGLNVAVGDQPPVIAGGLVASARYFSVLRLKMALGRPFGEAEDRPDGPPVVVLSHGFWTRVCGADKSIIGRTIRISGAAFTVIGVTAPGYRGLSQGGFFPATDVTVPISTQPLVMPRWSRVPAAGASLFTSNLFWVRVMGRIPHGSSDLTGAITGALRREFAGMPGATTSELDLVQALMVPGARGVDQIRANAEPPLRLLAGVSGIVLIMACLNLAGLQLARGVSRQRELAVRRALGAGRARIVRVLLAESLLLAALGGVLGVLLALWAAPVVTSMLATGLGAGGVDLGLDWSLVAIALAVSLTAALLSGLIPALRLSGRRAALLSIRSESSGARATTGRALIALQIAASVPLLVGAGLLLRTIHNLGSTDLGFDPNGLVVFQIDPGRLGGDADLDPVPLYERVLERVRVLPGVTSATLVENVLVTGRTSNTDVKVDNEPIRIRMNAVGPDFFETMRLPIVLGRPIGPGDRKGTPPVAVINQTAASTYFPGQSPIGRRLLVGKSELEIVGVAGTTLYRDLRTAPEPMFYDSFAQRSLDYFPGLAKILRSGTPNPINVVLRTSGSTAALAGAIPAAVREVEPALPIPDIKTHTELIAGTIERERMFMRLLVVFGGFAVLLACIGLHGVTAYAVARRTSEIGIRVALGAQRGQVLWLILKQVIVVTLAGIAIGVPVALAAGPVVGSLLFGLAPRDALTIAMASIAMLAVAIAAGWLPARRAARLPVVAALRQD